MECKGTGPKVNYDIKCPTSYSPRTKFSTKHWENLYLKLLYLLLLKLSYKFSQIWQHDISNTKEHCARGYDFQLKF